MLCTFQKSLTSKKRKTRLEIVFISGQDENEKDEKLTLHFPIIF